MRKFNCLILFFFTFYVAKAQVPSNDDCSNAYPLCANNLVSNPATNVNATSAGTDPILSCGPGAPKATVWYTVTAIANGTATIAVSMVDNNPGLTVEAFTGSCASLVSTSQCATGTGTLTINFATTTGTIYYIMVSGRGSNTEAFQILATSATNSIVARPAPDFIANPTSGCIPLSVLLQNTTTLYGGTNIAYQWKFDAGAFVNWSTADTTVLYPSMGTHTITLKVSNTECGFKQVLQDINAEDLFLSIGHSPATSCIGTPIQFNGSAVVLPDSVSPNVSSWNWNFGDPNSGANDSASIQNPPHTFVGPGNSFTVRLIVQGTCGPDTVTQVINLNPKPILHPSADQTICFGSPASLNVTVDNANGPVSYNWSGNPAITCSTCASTTVTGLAAGGPYTYTINIMDSLGCVADSLAHVTVNPIPVVNAGNDTTVCKYTSLTLSPTVTAGNPPFTYQWSPAAGLNNPTLKNPTAFITGTITYSVTVSDSIGCTSAPDAITINIFPKPSVSAVPSFYCSSDPGPYVPQFTVNDFGHAGSTYQWKLSKDYSLITGSNADSSVITATLPTGVVATDSFTVIVNDAVTGCADTITASFSVIAGVNLSVSASPSAICPGASSNLKAQGATTYAWTASPAYAFADSTNPDQAVSPAVTTLFIVTGTQGSCTKTDSIVVTVHPKPVVNAGNDTTVCKYSTVPLSANVTTGTSPFTYAWLPAAGLDDPAKKNPVATVSASTAYCVTVTDSIGCASDSDCVNLNIYPAPSISQSHAPYCDSDPGPDTTTFTVSVSGGTYSWKLSPNYIVITGTNADSSSVHLTLPTGVAATYSLTAIVTNPVTGCTDTVGTSVSVIAGVNLVVNGPFTICNGDSVMLTAQGSATTYAWTASPAYIFGDTTQQNQTVKPVVTTTFIVTGTTGTCSKTDSIKVTVNPKPVAAADSIPSSCGCVIDSLKGTGSSSGPSIKYVWTSLLGSVIANPKAQFTTATVCSADVFTLTVTDTVTGCSKSVSMPANSLPKPAAVANATPSLVCNGASTGVTLDGTGSDVAGGTTYTWSSVPAVSIANAAALLTTATVTGFTVFTLDVKNAAGCDSVVTSTVNIYPPPSISVSPGILCSSSPSMKDTVTLNGASPGSAYNWTVIPGCVTPPSTSAQSQVFDFTTCGAGTYSFTVVVTDAVNGCTDTLNTSVTVVSGVPLVVSPNDTICEGDSVILVASGANSYLWSNGTTTDTIVLKNLTSVMSPDTVTVTGTIAGCTAVDTIVVTINPVPVTSAINGPSNVCQRDTTTIFSVTNHPPNVYTWSVPAGDSVLTGQGTNSITVKWGAPDPATITVHETTPSACVSADQTLNVTVNANPAPNGIFGNNSVCANTQAVYSLSSTDFTSTYQWIATGSLAIDTSNFGFAIVTWGAGPAGSISVVETNAAGCSGDTASLPVTILPAPPKPILVGPDTVCENATGVIYNVTNTPGSFWIWFSDVGIPSASDSSQTTIDWGSPGNGMVFVVESDSNGCQSDMDTLLVAIDSLPVPSLILGNDTVCENEASVIYTVDSVPGVIYNWNVTSGGTIISGLGTHSITIDWGAPETDTITLSETSTPLGCIGLPVTKMVTVNPKPIPISINGPTAACENSMYQYFVDSTAGSTYQWTMTGGAISGSSTDTIVSVTWGSGPVGLVKVVETNAAGCIGDTDSLSVNVIASPAGPAISGPNKLCADSMGVIYSVTNNPGSYYLWTVTGGVIVPPSDSTNQVTVNWGAAGVDTIRVIEVNASGCQSFPDTMIVTLDPIPNTSPIVGDTSVCPNDSVPYFVTNTVGNIYIWTVSGDTISSGQTTDSIWVKWTAEGTDTITVLENAPGGCPGLKQTLLVTVHHKPNSTLITGKDSVCEGSTFTYFVTGDDSSKFKWNATGGSISGADSLDSVIVQWGTPGPGLLQVIETSKYGCVSAPAFFNVVVSPIPVTSGITGNDTVCITDTGNVYSVVLTVGSTYLWTATNDSITAGQGTNSITVNRKTSGSDTITVVETSNAGCMGIAVKKVVVINASPIASASASKTTLCQNDTVQLTGTDSNAVSVNWYTNGSGTFDDSTALSPIYTAGATDSGTVILTLVAHNPPCANDSAFVTLTVNPVPHIVIAPLTPSICIGDTDTLTVSAIGSYLWSPGGETTSSILVNPVITKTYKITVTNVSGCVSMDSTQVTVIPAGIADAGADQNVCLGDSIHLSGNIANAGGGVWTSSGNGKFIPDSLSLSAIYVPGTNDTLAFQLVLTTTGACLNGSDTMNVTVGAMPSANAGPDQTISYSDSAYLKGVVVNAGGLWTSSGSGFFVPSDTILNAIYVPSYADLQKKDSIVLTLTTTNGCKVATDYMVIYLSDSALTFSNVFTPYPNSPGYNDYFFIRGLAPGSKLKVWNRWGLLVYESENYRNDWDAADVPSEVYYYILMTTTKEYHGWVQVMK